MDKHEGIIISEYFEDNRVAIVFKEQKGYVVHLFEDGDLKKIADVSTHSLQYAEDCAENWVMKVGDFNAVGN